MVISKPLVGECLQCLKEHTLAVVRTNPQCKEEVVCHV